MRVSEANRFAAAAGGISRAAERLEGAQTALSSGQRIRVPSDDPTGTASAMRLASREADLAAYQRSIDDARAWLGTTDGALQQASNLLRRARDLTLTAGNATRSPTEREAIATELEAIRDQLVTVANTRYAGRSVFGGFQPDAVGGGPGAWAFTGDGGSVARRVGDDTVVEVSTDGARVFGFAAGDDVFSVLDRLAADIRAGQVDAVVGPDLAALDDRIADVLDALGSVGARGRLLDATEEANARDSDVVRRARSDITDVDMAEAALALARAETGYQAALAAASRVGVVSLLDFLR